jgi:predicted permease
MTWSRRAGSILSTLARDVQFGARLLRKSPGFTVVAILTLALGIGANTAIFSLLYSLAFRELPVPHPEQLVRFGPQQGGGPGIGMSFPAFEEIARSQKVFSSVFAWCNAAFNVEAEDGFSVAAVWAVTGNFHNDLGAVPEIGRVLAPEDADLHAASATQVAVLGYNFWQRHYGGDSKAIGRAVKIDGLPFTIIGVTRRAFSGMRSDGSPDVTIPLPAEPVITGRRDIQKAFQRRGERWLDAAARLRPGVTLHQAQAQLQAQWPAIREATLPLDQPLADREAYRALHLSVESGATGDSFLRGQFTRSLYLMFSLSGLVLLAACVNLASLTLARTAARGREIGVRVALGASRARLIGQMLTESLLLSAGGMLAGLVFAYWSSRAFATYVLSQTHIGLTSLSLPFDARILLFSSAAAVFTAVLFGIVPAWRFTGESHNVSVQESARIITAGTGMLGRTLIVAQIALSVVLLAAAGLFVRSLRELHAVDPGYRASGVLSVSARVKPGNQLRRDSDLGRYYRELTERMAAIPQVKSVALMRQHPNIGGPWHEDVKLAGSNAAAVHADLEVVTPGAFQVLEIGLLRGRDFTWRDDAHAPHVAIVSRSFAERMFPGQDSIGRMIEVPSESSWPAAQIVGIAADASLSDLRVRAQPTVYFPGVQLGLVCFPLVRTDVPVAAIAGSLRQAVGSLGLEDVYRLEELSAYIDRSLIRERVIAMLALFFGGLALLLSAIGLYGLMAYNVTRRTREIGIRMALGAQQPGVRWLVLRESLLLALLGIGAGLPCAMAASRWVGTLLFRVTIGDPAILTGICGALLAVAALATWLPAQRATHVDPMVALRHE